MSKNNDLSSRIDEIFNESNKTKVLNPKNNERLPGSKKLSNKNGYLAKVTAIFVDIRNSTELFSIKYKTTVAKIIKVFTSEIFKILSNGPLREIGVRGDCVYAIYSTLNKEEDYNIFEKAQEVNELMTGINEKLAEKKIDKITIGIGLSTNKQELVVKTGTCKNSINKTVWIGSGVTYAAKLSGLGNKGDIGTIVMSSEFYNSIASILNDNYRGDWISNNLEKKHFNDCEDFYFIRKDNGNL